MSRKTLIQDFTSGNVTQQLVVFALPLFFGNLLQVLYNAVDMIVVGNMAGSVGLSAVSVGGSLIDLYTKTVMGFSAAAQVIISHYLGAGRRKEIGKIIGTFSTVLFIAAVVCSVASIIFCREFLSWLNTPAESYEAAYGYAIISLGGLLFIFGYNAVSSILRGLGDSRHPFLFIAISAVINILLDLLFVGAFHMSAAGAALATILSQAFSFIISLVFLTRQKERLGFEITKRDFRIEKSYLSNIVKLGIPMALRNCAIQFSMTFANAFINSYGVAVSAITGVGTKIDNIAQLLSNAMVTAGATMIGQNIGAEEYDRVPRVLRSIFTIMSVVSIPLICLFVIFPRPIFSLFTSDQAVLNLIPEYLINVVLLIVSCVTRSGALAFINGSGNPVVNYIIAIMDAFVVRIGLGLLLGIVVGMGYRGFWLGNSISGFCPFIAVVFFYLSGKWRTNKYTIRR